MKRKKEKKKKKKKKKKKGKRARRARKKGCEKKALDEGKKEGSAIGSVETSERAESTKLQHVVTFECLTPLPT